MRFYFTKRFLKNQGQLSQSVCDKQAHGEGGLMII
jgi:hypothetical protein